jgi:tetratricopeptide (TPR) repeat protein/mono/diheme cytochrome c family protein
MALAVGWGPAVRAQPQLTFAHDIAPIIYQHCAPCHRPGQSGPFALLTYADVNKHADQIAAVTHSGFMPPWLPEAGYGTFAGERRLSEEERRKINDWVKQGAAEGEASETPALPAADAELPLGPPDLVLQASQALDVAASGEEVYWNFIFKPGLAATRYVKAVDIHPGNRRLVHHANLMIDRMGSAHFEETAPGRGFPGMDLTLMRNPFDPDGNLIHWEPGVVPSPEPDGLAWRLDPGNELVLNMHLLPSGKIEQVRPTVGLYFTSQPPNRFPIVIELENDPALRIPPGTRDFLVSDDFRLPMDADILAVYPHAHYLGKLLEAYATLPTGERRWLIRILDWDKNWEDVYRYREPVFLPKGSVISMRYHYDNSAENPRNPNNPPRLVEGGNRTTDEMCHLWLQVLPRGPADRRRELQEAVMRHRLELQPTDFEARLNLGALLLSRLNAQEAVAMLESAVRLDPRRPEARNMLGLGLARVGRTREAIEQFETALAARPDYASARFNLANALVKTGRLEEAIADFRQVLAGDPANSVSRERLAAALEARADALAEEGRRPEAEALRQEAEKLRGTGEGPR